MWGRGSVAVLTMLGLGALVAFGAPAAAAEVAIVSIAPWSTFRPDTAFGVLHGTELVIDAVNAAGGLLGQELRNVPIDDGCDPVQAEAAAKIAVSSKPVLAVGGACSTAAGHVSQLLAAAGILQILPNAAAMTMTQAGIGTLFRMTARPDHEGAFAGELIAARWRDRRIAVLDDGSVNWHEAAGAVVAALRQHGIEPVLATTFKPNQPNYNALVQTLKEARATLLYVTGRPSDMGLIAHEIEAAGLALQIVGGRNAGVAAFLQTAGAAAEGLLFTERHDWIEDALADPVLAAEKERRGDLGIFVVSAYAGVKIWVEAVQATQSFDAATVAQAIKQRHFVTALGDIAFDENGALTPQSEAWSWHRWHGGRIEPAP